MNREVILTTIIDGEIRREVVYQVDPEKELYSISGMPTGKTTDDLKKIVQRDDLMFFLDELGIFSLPRANVKHIQYTMSEN